MLGALCIKCKSCGALLCLGLQVCKECGAGGLFTPGPLRKPVTPYAVRKEGFVRKSVEQRSEAKKVDFRALKGTLLAAAASDATKMALQPRHRVAWADVVLSTQIGEGAYANVYEGTWQGAVVAVKEMKLQEASETQASDFLTEVTVLASLSHPNVIDFIGACTEPDHLAILLEFMPGGDASILLARDDVQITWERRLSWLLDVAKAMQYLHSRTPQIIHRDLKTENVLISADFLTAKVTDFGLSQAKAAAFVASYDISSTGGLTPRVAQVSSPPGARAGSPVSPHLMGSVERLIVKTSSTSQTGALPRKVVSSKRQHAKRSSVDLGSQQMMRMQRLDMRHFSMEAGTPAYVAPEIWRCEPYSERVDAYSFAIVMWEFMTREWAFDDMDVEEIIERVRDEKERPDVPDWCPRSFNTLLTECWSETPLFRPSFENIVRRLDVLLKESAEWPSIPNEWPEATYNERNQGLEEEVEEIFEEEIIEETIVEEEDPGDEPAKSSPVPPAMSIVSPAFERLKTKKGSIGVLSVSSEDMEKKGVEFLLQQMMEECIEQDEQENEDDVE